MASDCTKYNKIYTFEPTDGLIVTTFRIFKHDFNADHPNSNINDSSNHYERIVAPVVDMFVGVQFKD